MPAAGAEEPEGPQPFYGDKPPDDTSRRWKNTRTDLWMVFSSGAWVPDGAEDLKE